jgi:type IV pilus assembly protein PilE
MNSIRNRGFSLIELMIAIAVVSILAAVSYPSYREYVIRSSREAAKAELLQFANLQEKIYLNASSYATSMTIAYNGRADGGLGNTSGRSGDGKYTFSIAPTAGPTNVYTITATPVTGSTQAADGNLTLSSDGTRAWGSKTW